MMEERGAFLIQADHIAHDFDEARENPSITKWVKRFWPGDRQ